MASRFKVFTCCLLFSLFLCPSKAGALRRPRSKRQIEKQSALGSILAFSVKISDMEKRIAAHDKKIDEQKQQLSELQTKVDEKSDRIQFRRLSDLLNIRTHSLRNYLNFGRNLVQRSQERLEGLDDAFSDVERQYTQLEGDVRDIKERFDNEAVSCHRRRTAWAYRADGSVGFLSSHLLSCRRDEFLQRFTLQRENTDVNSRVRYVYTCCSFDL